MTFPLYYLLYIFGLFLVFWLLYSMAGIYHMLRFGLRRFSTIFVVLFYLGGSVVLAGLSFYWLSPIDWQQKVSLGAGFFNMSANF